MHQTPGDKSPSPWLCSIVDPDVVAAASLCDKLSHAGGANCDTDRVNTGNVGRQCAGPVSKSSQESGSGCNIHNRVAAMDVATGILYCCWCVWA